MGKTKQPPQQPVKIIRSLGENLTVLVSEEEKKYRNKNGPDDVKDIKKDKLKCTVCAKSVADIVKRGAEPFVHMVLGVLVCKDCSSFYGDGYFSVDEDGDDKYCRWCGQGGTLYICSACSCAFCKKCIKQNLGKQDLKDLESDDWQCFICNPKPLYECRTICWALQEHAANLKTARHSGGADSLPTTRSRRDRGNSSCVTVSSERLSNSKKRRADDIEHFGNSDVEVKSKKRKISEKTKLQKSNEYPSRTLESDTEVSSPTKSEPRSKRSRSSYENENSPIKKSLRNPKKQDNKSKIEEIFLSDEQEIIRESPKKSPKKAINKKKSNTSTKKSKKIESDSKNKENESFLQHSYTDSSLGSPTKTTGVAKKSSKTTTKQNKKGESSQNVIKEKQSCTNDSEESCKESESPIAEDSASETEFKSKNRTSKSKLKKSNDKTTKAQLSIGKNADSNVIDGCGYVNAAVKDVTDLSVLITTHCERLCSKVVNTNDDVLRAFVKLKELMGGVTSNLETIEKGLDNKINKWKGIELEKQDQIKTLELINPNDDDKIGNEILKESCHITKDDKNISLEVDGKIENVVENFKSEDGVDPNKDFVEETTKTVDFLEKDDVQEKEDSILTETDNVCVEEKPNQTSETIENKDKNVLIDVSIEKKDKNVLIEVSIENKEKSESCGAIEDTSNIDCKIQPNISGENNTNFENSENNVDVTVDNKESTVKEHDEYEDQSNTVYEKSIELDENNSSGSCSIPEKSSCNQLNLSEKSDSNMIKNEETINTNMGSTVGEEIISEMNDNDKIENTESSIKAVDSGMESNMADEELDVIKEAEISNNSDFKDADVLEDESLNSSSNGLHCLQKNLNEEEKVQDLYTMAKKEEELVQLAEKNETSCVSNPNETVKEFSTEEDKEEKSPLRETGDHKNGIHDNEDNKTKEKESTEEKPTERKEDIIKKISNDEQKKIPSLHRSEPPRRPSGSFSHQGSQRWSADRGRDWNQHRYPGDRWSTGGHSSSWNRYDDRRPKRGGWGWSH